MREGGFAYLPPGARWTCTFDCTSIKCALVSSECTSYHSHYCSLAIAFKSLWCIRHSCLDLSSTLVAIRWYRSLGGMPPNSKSAFANCFSCLAVHTSLSSISRQVGAARRFVSAAARRDSARKAWRRRSSSMSKRITFLPALWFRRYWVVFVWNPANRNNKTAPSVTATITARSSHWRRRARCFVSNTNALILAVASL